MRGETLGRRTVLKAAGVSIAVTGIVGGASGSGTGTQDDEYEVWALDQWTDTAHVLEPDGDGNLNEIDSIDLSDDHEDIDGNPDADDRTTPHMIDFTSEFAYAFVAATQAGKTIVIDAQEREVVEVLDTGAGSHFAGVMPGDERVHVDAIGDEKIVEVVVDADEETFEIDRELEVDLTEREGFGFPSNAPVCHDYRHDGQFAYVTFGPAFEDAGLARLNTRSMRLTEAYDPESVRANCGTLRHPTEDKIYLNGGAFDDGGPIDESPWYVVNTQNHDVVHEDDTAAEIDGERSGGVDAHGLWFSPDESELWMVNRGSNDGIVIDPETNEIVDVIEQVGPAAVEDEPPYTEEEYDDLPPDNPGDRPDILAAPTGDSRYVYCTLRGLDPQSAAAGGFGETPGVAVLDVETRERESVWQTGADPEESDFHGIAVRELDDR